ncbi:lactoylglutathione lyase [Duganella sp. FT92W]|uniref:Lactoylglutathione lyase n=1 Tax=Pseudoduganella rivuli TaxID=2666085 RepID=A0A7X2IJ76_9BURK|nr:lactoylglutathione lyase [Pseudoduganella rivuli]MRV70537.1 lactoylglutathione lyase [Pseudoduganella rivuli]
MFELLLSADMMISDPDGMTELLVDKLGIYKHEKWRQAFEHHPYIAHFLRVHKSLAVSPTRIEPQVHLDKPNPGDPLFHDFLQSLEAYQGKHRPLLTHSIVLAMHGPKFDKFVEKLMRRRLPFRMAQRTDDMPFDRLWLGCTPERPYYEPSVDGGLCIEVMPTEPLQMPPETFADIPPQPRDLAPGGMVRVTARGFLVRNLDETLRKVSTNLDWEPVGPVELLRNEGYRRARMGFTVANSASLDVIEATRWDSDAGLYVNNWGPGPYYIRIGVNDLNAKAEDLRARGTAFTWIEESEAVGGRSLIKVDPAQLRGQLFEFEQC